MAMPTDFYALKLYFLKLKFEKSSSYFYFFMTIKYFSFSHRHHFITHTLYFVLLLADIEEEDWI